MNDDVTLLLGDCLDLMKELPAGSVDAVVTDPPYGIGFEYNNGREAAQTPSEYWEWLMPKYTEFVRVLRPGGLLAIWQAALYFPHFWDWFGDDIRIYAACKNFVQLRKTPINYGFDPVVMLYKDNGDPLRPDRPGRNIDFFVANTAAVVSDPTRPERAHPCPRPLDATREIVDNFSLPNGTVLDPFMGSGTTGVACVQTRRKFIGIEIDKRYYDIACKRIKVAEAQMRLPV